MTTRITAIHDNGTGTAQSHTRTINAEVDDSTARLIGLGMLFDAGLAPPTGGATVDVRVQRERACLRANLGGVRAAKEAAMEAQAKPARETAGERAARFGCGRWNPVVIAGGHLAPTPEAIREARRIAAIIISPRRAKDENWRRSIRRLTAMHGTVPVVVAESIDSTDYEVYETQAQVIAWADGLSLAASAVGKPVLDGQSGPEVGRIVSAEQRGEQIHARVEVDQLPDGLLSIAREREAFERAVSLPGAFIGVVARPHGMAGALADVLEFHNAVAETNTAYITQRNGPAALVRAVSRYSLLEEEWREYTKAMIEGDVVGVLDALVDMAYVIVGTGLIQFGRESFARAWAAVHESNMAKRWADGTFHLREDGKVLKPEGWEAPDLASIVYDSAELRRVEGMLWSVREGEPGFVTGLRGSDGDPG